MSATDSGFAIVGIGRTPCYRRGESVPQTPSAFARQAMIGHPDDADLVMDNLGSLSWHAGGWANPGGGKTVPEFVAHGGPRPAACPPR